jgi:hypothetical protein
LLCILVGLTPRKLDSRPRLCHRCKMTPQQHQREATHRKVRMSRTPDPSPDSDSARNTLSKSGLGSKLGPQDKDVAGSGGGPLPESFRCRLEFVPRGSGRGLAGAPRRGHQSGHGSGRVAFSVQQKSHREPPIASGVGGGIFAPTLYPKMLKREGIDRPPDRQEHVWAGSWSVASFGAASWP